MLPPTSASGFPEQFVEAVGRLVFRDYGFLQQAKSSAPPSFFSEIRNGAQWEAVVRALYEYHDRYHAPMTEAAFEVTADALVASRPEAEHKVWRDALSYINAAVWRMPVIDGPFVQSRFFDWVKEQRLKVLVLRMRDDIRSGSLDMTRYMEDLKDASRLSPKMFSQLDLFRDVDATYAFAMSSQQRPCVPTGLRSIDKALGGGVGRGELLVFEGPPNRGKTSIMCAVTASLLKWSHANVVYISLEMSKLLVFQKMVANITDVDPKEFHNNGQRIYHKLAHMKNATRSRLQLDQFPSSKFTVEAMYTYLSQVQQHWGQRIDAVVVDYPDLMTSLDKREKRYEEVAGIYRGLRSLAVELDFACIGATQTNRQGAAKEVVTMEDLAECYEKAAIADVILSICQTPQEYQAGALRLFVAKNRVEQKFFEIPFGIKFNLALLEEREMAESGGQRPIYNLPNSTDMLAAMAAPPPPPPSIR